MLPNPEEVEFCRMERAGTFVPDTISRRRSGECFRLNYTSSSCGLQRCGPHTGMGEETWRAEKRSSPGGGHTILPLLRSTEACVVFDIQGVFGTGGSSWSTGESCAFLTRSRTAMRQLITFSFQARLLTIRSSWFGVIGSSGSRESRGTSSR